MFYAMCQLIVERSQKTSGQNSYELVYRLMHVELWNKQDIFVWGLTNSGMFTENICI
jgi:hypothetical protein